MAVDYLDKSPKRKNMGKTFNCGKMPLGGGSLLFHSTSMSRFLQSFAKLFCQQLENYQKSACLLRQLKFQIPWQTALLRLITGRGWEEYSEVYKSQPTNSTKLRGYSYPYFCIQRARGILVMRHTETNQIMNISAKYCAKTTIKHLKSCLCSDKKEQV